VKAEGGDERLLSKAAGVNGPKAQQPSAVHPAKNCQITQVIHGFPFQTPITLPDP